MLVFTPTVKGSLTAHISVEDKKKDLNDKIRRFVQREKVF